MPVLFSAITSTRPLYNGRCFAVSPKKATKAINRQIKPSWLGFVKICKNADPMETALSNYGLYIIIIII